jgi:hypothetical protein
MQIVLIAPPIETESGTAKLTKRQPSFLSVATVPVEVATCVDVVYSLVNNLVALGQ